jgi:triosephosphate isomerase
MRIPVIAANWKMYKTNAETRQFIADFEPLVKDVRDVEIILAPPFTSLSAAAKQITLSSIKLSAQNVFYEKQGAFTGEISPQMVKDCGCYHVITGHSERRQYFSESDAVINRKIRAAQEAGLVVIFCVGETLVEREAGKTLEVISRQVRAGLGDTDPGRLIIAYEPVWAIGTGKNATPEQAQEVHGNIRNLLKKLGSNAEDVRILYGGSVKPDNIGVLMQKDDIDGALVGGASLDPVSFSKIVKY